jgi:Sec-independent protein translocase protein TatA
MLETLGLLQLTARSENYRREGQLLYRNYGPSSQYAASPSNSTATTSGASNSSLSTLANSANRSLAAKSAITLPKGALDGPMHDFWQKAADKAAERAPSAVTMKRLEQASKSDNKEIAAQKLQQAKAKLQSLRMQAQMAAAAGDRKQLQHIAQEVAATTREIASAAHDLAGGVVESATGADSAALPSGTSGDAATSENTTTEKAPAAAGDATATAAAAAAKAEATKEPASTGTTTTTAGTTATPDHASGDSATAGTATTADAAKDLPIYAQSAPQDGDKLLWGEKALRSLANDAGSAIAQARGLLAFIATALRSRRDPSEAVSEDRFITDLQQAVDEADHQVTSDIAAASRDLVASQASPEPAAAGGTDGGSVLGIESVTMTQVTTTALFLNITA